MQAWDTWQCANSWVVMSASDMLNSWAVMLASDHGQLASDHGQLCWHALDHGQLCASDMLSHGSCNLEDGGRQLCCVLSYCSLSPSS